MGGLDTLVCLRRTITNIVEKIAIIVEKHYNEVQSFSASLGTVLNSFRRYIFDIKLMRVCVLY